MSLEQDIDCQAVEIILQKLYAVIGGIAKVSDIDTPPASMESLIGALHSLNQTYALKSTVIKHYGLINADNILAKMIAFSKIPLQTTIDGLAKVLKDETVFVRFIIYYGFYCSASLRLAKQYLAEIIYTPNDGEVGEIVNVKDVEKAFRKVTKAYQELCKEIN